MTIENISWSISTKECCRPQWGLTPDLLVSSRTNWAIEAAYHQSGLEKLKNPNRSSIFSPQKRKLPNRFSVISVTVVCFHSVLFFSFKIQGASSLLAQRLTYQYCFNTCSININIGISIINSNFAPTVQTRHISSTFIFPISGSLSYWRVLKGNNRRSKAIFALW